MASNNAGQQSSGGRWPVFPPGSNKEPLNLAAIPNTPVTQYINQVQQPLWTDSYNPSYQHFTQTNNQHQEGSEIPRHSQQQNINTPGQYQPQLGAVIAPNQHFRQRYRCVGPHNVKTSAIVHQRQQYVQQYPQLPATASGSFPQANFVYQQQIMPPQQSFGYNQELDALQYQQQDLRNSSSLNSGTKQNPEIKEQVKPLMDQLVTLLKKQPHNNENNERQNRRRGNFSNCRNNCPSCREYCQKQCLRCQVLQSDIFQ